MWNEDDFEVTPTFDSVAVFYIGDRKLSSEKCVELVEAGDNGRGGGGDTLRGRYDEGFNDSQEEDYWSSELSFTPGTSVSTDEPDGFHVTPDDSDHGATDQCRGQESSTDQDDGIQELEITRKFYIHPEIENVDDFFGSGVSTGVNFIKFDNLEVCVIGNKPPSPVFTFESSGLKPQLLENIERSGYSHPTATEKYSIPIILEGRDLMSCGQKGSGKTAAFMLPIINQLLINTNRPNRENCTYPEVVILSPTKELAIEVGEQCRQFTLNSTIQTAIVYDGSSICHQRCRILGGCHILVATPRRLKNFLNRRYVSFSKLKYFVVDEIDRILNMGLLGDVEEMLLHQTMPPIGARQTLIFSAIFPQEIQILAEKFLHNYIFLSIGTFGSVFKDVKQEFLLVNKFDKKVKLLSLLKETPDESTLIFVAAKRLSKFLAIALNENNIPSTSIHGGLYQKEREEALHDFKIGKAKILITTDVAAKGIDTKDVKQVINYDLPNYIDDYVHRMRTMIRIGNYGRVTSFFDADEDQNLVGPLIKILSQANQEIPDWLRNYSGVGSVDQVVGQDKRGDNLECGPNLGPLPAEPQAKWKKFLCVLMACTTACFPI